MKAKVIVASWGGSKRFMQTLYDAIDDFGNTQGVLPSVLKPRSL